MSSTRLLSYVKPGPSVDQSGEADMDVIAEIATGIAEKIRDFDGRRLFDELAQLCHHHPYKAAQIIMCFAAWFNQEEPVQSLWQRVDSIIDGRWAA